MTTNLSILRQKVLFTLSSPSCSSAILTQLVLWSLSPFLIIVKKKDCEAVVCQLQIRMKAQYSWFQQTPPFTLSKYASAFTHCSLISSMYRFLYALHAFTTKNVVRNVTHASVLEPTCGLSNINNWLIHHHVSKSSCHNYLLSNDAHPTPNDGCFNSNVGGRREGAHALCVVHAWSVFR